MIYEAFVHKGQQAFLEIVQTMPARTPDHFSHLLPHLLMFPNSQERQELPTQSQTMPATRLGRLLVDLLHSVPQTQLSGSPESCDSSSSPILPFLEPLTGEGEVRGGLKGVHMDLPGKGELEYIWQVD